MSGRPPPNKPWPHAWHKCAGEPILDAWTHQAIRSYPGATADEITEKVLSIAGWKDQYDRRLARDRVLQIMGAPPAQAVDPDWDAIVTRYREWTARTGNQGLLMPKAEMIAETGMGRDRIDKALRRHDVTDYRFLRSYMAQPTAR